MSQRWDYIANIVFVKERLTDGNAANTNKLWMINAQYMRSHKKNGQQ